MWSERSVAMAKRIFEFIGILMIALGVSTADSEWLIIPVGFITVGFIVMRAVERSDNDGKN